MDPDTCLEELRKLLAKYKQQKDNLDEADVQDLVVRAEAIDDWMSKGGFLPKTWQETRRTEGADAERDRIIAYVRLCAEADPSTMFQYNQLAALLKRNDHRDPKYKLGDAT